jgi:hypothetical protein
MVIGYDERARPEDQTMMKTIETDGVVGAGHSVLLRLSEDVPTGQHRFLVTIVDGVAAEPPVIQVFDVGPWPEGFTVSREQIYGDDGR